MAHEDKPLRGYRSVNREHGAQREKGELFWRNCVDQISVTARHSADFFWLWTRPQAGRNDGVGKAQRACRQKFLRGGRMFFLVM